MAKQINTRIINKHDTQANWAKATGFIPEKGEILIVDDLTPPGIMIGDGTTPASRLPMSTEQIDIVYSPNGTMLSQKLDGDGSFEFVNEPANITSKQFTEATRVGTYAVTLGGKSAATGKRALAEGTSTWAEGNYSHAEGNKSYAKGAQAHAEGAQTYAQGDESHSEGYMTHAQGLASHAEGAGTLASGAHSHAEGGDTVASGEISHAEGINTQATGYASHAEGHHSIASNSNSHASGWYTRTSAENQTVVGQANKDDDQALFIVGNGNYYWANMEGPTEADRKNAFAVMATSEPTIKIGNTTLTETQLIKIINFIDSIEG